MVTIKRWQYRLSLVAAALVIGLCAWWLWYSHRDYGRGFVNRAGEMAGIERSWVSGAHSIQTYDLLIKASTGLRAEARMAVPDDIASSRFNHGHGVPAILLVAGVNTGKRAIDLIPPQRDMVVMALDYGWSGQFNIRNASELKAGLRSIRATSMDAVPRALLALDALMVEPGVDTNRVVVVGVSYGAYIALPATVLHPLPGELIMVQGGAEIGPAVAANAAMWDAPLPAWLAGHVGEVVFAPFDPYRWIKKLPPRRLTMMVSPQDATMPVGSLTNVFAAARGDQNRWITATTGHVGPDTAEIIALLAGKIEEHVRDRFNTESHWP